ncbi:MAG TPA: hypothetical protein VEU97_13860 [Ktedonobacteraceae bacterium]|nr:hypothetical protein [Ktedonobacteraceae bacterium]
MQSTIDVARRRELLLRVVLLGTPVLLGILELGHPLLDHMNTIKMLAPIVDWWIILHLLLVPLFALMGWTFFLLLRGIQNGAATLCRYATVIYISFSIGYDTLVGLNSGILASNALTMPNAQRAIVQDAIRQMFMSAPIFLTYYTLLGSGIVSICAATWALARAGVPRLPVFVLLGTLLSAYSHATPFGPLGSACFFLAALWIELVWRKVPKGEGEVAPSVVTPV